MDTHQESSAKVLAALFIDFDNIYSNLREQDALIANQFATNPNRWLDWLESKLPVVGIASGSARRRILVRRCYLNPQVYSRYRPYFIQSAFEVVDCPTLTYTGKTSADIHMVIDILDTLVSPTNYQEFIILSGDTDFMPIVTRLRKHDRYSLVLSTGNVSPAYRASCDHFIDQDDFVRFGLGFSLQEEEIDLQELDQVEVEVPEELLNRMAARMYEVAVLPTGIDISNLPAVFREFGEFKKSTNWLGFYSLRRLTAALVARRDDLAIVEEDPWRVARLQFTRVDELLSERPPGVPAEVPPQDLRSAIAEWIKATVKAAVAPVPMAVLAQGIRERFQDYFSGTDWFGFATFKSLLSQIDLGELKISDVIPGYVYDPSRHDIPGPAAPVGPVPLNNVLAAPAVDTFSLKYPELAPLARKIHQLTDTPYLLPEHYILLFVELARQINEQGYQLTRTSRTVRDRCVERGAPVSRSHVNFVLFGIGYTGHRLGGGSPETAEGLGEAFLRNTLNLCSNAQLELTEEEEKQVRDWIFNPQARMDNDQPVLE